MAGWVAPLPHLYCRISSGWRSQRSFLTLSSCVLSPPTLGGGGEEASRDMSPVKYNIKGFNNISGDGCSINIEHYAHKNLVRFNLEEPSHDI